MACENLQAQVNSLQGRIAAAQNRLDRSGGDAGSREAQLAALQDLQRELTAAEQNLANCLKRALVPDFLVQAQDPRPNVSPCLTPELRATIQDIITAQFQALFPGAYVDNDCVGDSPNQVAAFGVWITPASPLTDSVKQQYHAELATNIGRTTQESIAFYLNATLFEAVLPLVETTVKQALPRSIQLTAPMALSFQAPDTMVTTIRGVDTEATPDVSFTLTITEKFLGGPGIPNWDATTSHLDKDELGVILADVVSAALAVGGAFLSLGTLGVTIPLYALATFQAWEVLSAFAPAPQSVGGAIAQLIMPPSIPIPGGLKIPIVYSLRTSHNAGVEIDDTGMYVGGILLQPVPRTPAVTLAGATTVNLHTGGLAQSDTISITSAVDFRGALAYAWTVNGKAKAGGTSLRLSFNPSTGPFGTQTVTVKVTDEDGLSASASLEITVSLTQPPSRGSDNPMHPA